MRTSSKLRRPDVTIANASEDGPAFAWSATGEVAKVVVKGGQSILQPAAHGHARHATSVPDGSWRLSLLGAAAILATFLLVLPEGDRRR